ncbi:MAG: DUF1552 domain-containing protein [Acidobacteria bacterium]|nr:DUF1552 domain-containing protein [Acidobacteriota bacterium]
MLVTKKHISRRTVLRGMGSAIALPFLEAMVPAQTPLRNTAATPKSRFAAIEVVHGCAGSTPHGNDLALWRPFKEGRDFEFGTIIKPVEPFRDYVTIVSNLDCEGAESRVPEEVGADHFRNAAVFLTAAHPKQTVGADVYCGASIDQIYAQTHGQDTPLPSIQLCTEVMDASGSCAYKYSCVYMDTISWSSPTTPLPMTYNPRAAFEEIFGLGGSAEDRAKRQKMNLSVLDSITHDVARLKKDLDARDNGRLTDYLDSVREIERRIQAIEAHNRSGAKREMASAPVGVPDSWDEWVKLMMDLEVAAFASNVTRVAALKLGRDVSDRIFPESGNTKPFHSASHHGETDKGIESFAEINRYHVSLVAYFLDKLKNSPDGDGNLLDHSLVLYGSAMGDSHVHAHKMVPALLAGKASGKIKGNLHLKMPTGTPQANLLLTILHKLGVEQSEIGDSTGTISI